MTTGKNAVIINGHPVALTDSQVRDLLAKVTGKRKPKLKRAADRAWDILAKTVADFQPKGRKVIDNSKARGLQEIFSAGRREALEPLAVECRNIAFEIAKKYQRFDRERREEIAHEAASRLIERFLKDPSYHVRSFSGILRIEILNVVTGGVKNGRPCVEIERTMGSIDDAVLSDTRQPKGDERTYFDDLRTEHPEGDRIILDLYRATTFRAAVLRLAEYVDRRWLYDRSAKLRTVYRMTRRVKNANRNM